MIKMAVITSPLSGILTHFNKKGYGRIIHSQIAGEILYL